MQVLISKSNIRRFLSREAGNDVMRLNIVQAVSSIKQEHYSKLIIRRFLSRKVKYAVMRLEIFKAVP